MASMKLGRNDPCPCGSGKKYKNCCQNRNAPSERQPVRPSAASSAKNIPARGTTPDPAKINLLAALYNAGRFVELEGHANSLIQQYPDYWPAWKILAASLHVQGKDPLPALQMATRLLPNDAETHYNLGYSLQGHKRLDDAVASYRRALKIRPDLVNAHFNLGNCLKDLGQLDDAVASYRRALQIKPDYVDVLCNLGNVLYDLRQYEPAIACYRQALQIKPDYADVLYNLGNVLHDIWQYESAIACYRQALAIKPDYTEAHLNLANALLDIMQLVEATACYRRALEIDPGNNDALVGLGDILSYNGDINRAEDLYRQVLAKDGENIQARYCLAQLRKVKTEDENLAALEAAELRSRQPEHQLPDKTAIMLHFALGKSYEDTKQYDKAFPHFLEGCRLKRATLDYDQNKFARNIDTIISVFDLSLLKRFRGCGDMSDVPIFVLGMPRSGTTLTEQIIASHPDVHGGGELLDMLSIAHRSVAGATYPQNLLAIDRAQLAAWGADYVSGIQKRAPDARHITDKTPGNFIFIGLIHLILPNAKIIHVNRNPVDNCISCFTQLFHVRNEQTYDLSELGHYYVHYAQLMDHWRNILPSGTFLDVQYEEIVADQEAQTRRMLEFIGLEWNDACLDFHKHTRSIRTASVAQVRQPIYSSSVEKWRNYESYLTPLLEALGDLAPKHA